MSKNQEIAALSVSLALATEKFDKAITAVNKQVRITEREFKEASKGIENFENSFEGLDLQIRHTTKQLDLYGQKLDAQKKKLKETEETYENQKKKLQEIEVEQGKNSKAWKDQAINLQKTSTKLVQINADIERTEATIQKLSGELEQSQNKFDQLEKAMEGTGDASKTLQDKLEGIKDSTNLSISELDKLKSSLTESATKFDKLQIEVDKAEKKLQGSKSTLSAYQDEVKRLENTLSNSKQEYERLGSSINELKTKLEGAKSKFGESSKEVLDLKKELYQLKDAQNKVANETQQTGKALINLKTDTNRAGKEVNDLEKEFSDLQKELNRLNTKKPVEEFNKLIKEFKETENEATKFADNIGGIGDKCKGVSVAFAGIGAGAFATAVESSNAMGKIQGGLGLTAKEADKVKDRVRNLATEGFEFSGALDGITKVEQAMGDMLDPSQIDDMVGELMVMENYFGADMQDSIKTVSVMMRNYGIEGQEATDVIAKGFQIGLDASGDWLDTLWEYSNQFSDLGFTADDTLKLIANGMENGTFNTDKLADALKESRIKLTEMDKSATEGVQSLGLNVNKVQKNIGAGGETARNQMVELAKKIMAIEDPVKRNAIGVAIFGTMFEDLGIEAVNAIAGINDNLIESEGCADQVKESYQETFGAKFTAMLERTKEPLEKIGEVILDIVEPLIEVGGKLGDIIDKVPGLDVAIAMFIGIGVALTPVVSAIGTFSRLFGHLSPLFAEGTAGAKLLEGGFGLLKGAFSSIWGFATKNLFPMFVQLVTKIGLPGLAIGVLIGAGVLLVKHWDEIKEFASKVWDSIKDKVSDVCESANEVITNVWGGIKDFFSGTWEGIKGIFETYIQIVATFWTNVWETIRDFVKPIWDAITDTISSAWDGIVGVVQPMAEYVGEIIDIVWTTIKNITKAIWDFIVSIISGVWETIKALVELAVAVVKKCIELAWNWIKDKTSEIWNNIKDKISEVWNGIKDKINETCNIIKDNVKSIWDNIKSAIDTTCKSIRDVVSNIWNAIKDKVTQVCNSIRDAILPIWNNIKDRVSNIANNIKDSVTDKFNALKDKVSNIFNKVKDVVKSIWDKIKDTISQTADKIKTKISQVFGTLEDIITKPFKKAKEKIDKFFGGVVEGIKNTTDKINKLGNKKSITIEGEFDTTDIPEGEISTRAGESQQVTRGLPQSYQNLSVFGMINKLSKEMNKFDYSSNRYKNKSNPVVDSVETNVNINLIGQLKQQNMLLTKLLYAVQSPAPNVSLNIQNFNNNTKDDINSIADDIANLIIRKTLV